MHAHAPSLIAADDVRVGIHSGQQYPHMPLALALWERAEGLGYDWLSVFDHFRPPDRPTGPCFEATTLLAAMAARTRRVRCAALVLAVEYRHPGMLASIGSTLDHVSGGRLELGLGAGAPDDAHAQYGIPVHGIRARLEMLDETCTILRALWTQESTTFSGKFFRLNGATLEPKPVQSHLPLVIAGAGQDRMLPLVAKHADVWNTVDNDVEHYRATVDRLASHCDAVGRPRAGLRRSLLFRVVLAASHREARERLADLLGTVSVAPERAGYLMVGTPDECVERLRAYHAAGVRDFLLGVRVPFDWATVELFASAVTPALRTMTGA